MSQDSLIDHDHNDDDDDDEDDNKPIQQISSIINTISTRVQSKH